MEAHESYHTDPVTLLPKVVAGEALPEEIRKVTEWIAESPSHKKEYDDFVRIWNMTEQAVSSDVLDVDGEWDKLENTLFGKRLLPWKRILQVAALVVLVSSLAFFALKQGSRRSIAAGAAQITETVLPDGSTLYLNAGSKITYRKDFGRLHRQLRLQGEAYFEVKKNARLPFVVAAGGALVEVTGTRFNVRAYRHADRISVTVTEGTVRLSEARTPANQTPVQAGETGWFVPENRSISHAPTLNPNTLSWKTGILDFRDTPLPEVIAVLANTYHRSFDLSPALNRCTVTVRFDHRSLEEVLSVLQSTLGLEVREDGKHIVISGPGC